MSEENKNPEDESGKSGDKTGVKLAQVTAAALAAVTAALLGSTLGVAGTVVGAGIASIVTTIGSELYLRSLQASREAAQRTKERTKDIAKVLAAGAGARTWSADDSRSTQRLRAASGAKSEQASASETRVSGPPAEVSKLRRLRWPLIIGVSALSFALAFFIITGIEGVTKKPLSGGNGTSVGKLFSGGGDQAPQEKQPPAPTTTPAKPTSDAPSQTSEPAPPTQSEETEPANPPASTTTSTPPSSSKSTTSAPSSTNAPNEG